MLVGRRASGKDNLKKPESSFSFNNDIQVLSHIHSIVKEESPCLAAEAVTVPGEEADDVVDDNYQNATFNDNKDNNNSVAEYSKQTEPRSERLR